MIIDTHCHLDKIADTKIELSTILKEAQKIGIIYIISVATNLKEAQKISQFSKDFKSIYYTVGIHPAEIKSTDNLQKDFDNIQPYLKSKKFVAIGETGLDYLNKNITKEIKKQQTKNFEFHIDLANMLLKPIIIHSRNSETDTLNLLKKINVNKSGGVLHCFTGSWEMAKIALDLGLYISISGIVTFRNAYKLREIAKKIPLDRLVIETDSPYLAPEPYRGKKNYPKYLYETAKFLSYIREENLEELCFNTSKNAIALFKLKNINLGENN